MCGLVHVFSARGVVDDATNSFAKQIGVDHHTSVTFGNCDGDGQFVAVHVLFRDRIDKEFQTYTLDFPVNASTGGGGQDALDNLRDRPEALESVPQLCLHIGVSD